MNTIMQIPDSLYQSMFESDNMRHLSYAATLLRFVVPVLWGLLMVMILRMSADSCTNPLHRNYKVFAASVVGVSIIMYIIAYFIVQLDLHAGVLLVSFLLTLGIISSAMGKYREEFW